jgi:hypothetical protein
MTLFFTKTRQSSSFCLSPQQPVSTINWGKVLLFPPGWYSPQCSARDYRRVRPEARLMWPSKAPLPCQSVAWFNQKIQRLDLQCRVDVTPNFRKNVLYHTRPQQFFTSQEHLRFMSLHIDFENLNVGFARKPAPLPGKVVKSCDRYFGSKLKRNDISYSSFLVLNFPSPTYKYQDIYSNWALVFPQSNPKCSRASTRTRLDGNRQKISTVDFQ